MLDDLTTSHSGYAYCGQSWLTAVLPLPCVPCVSEVVGVCVCVSLVSRCSKENGEDRLVSTVRTCVAS